MSKSEKSLRTKQIWFMPWADLSEEIRLGDCTVWPFVNDQIERRITDDAVKEHLHRYFENYVGHDGKPVNSVAICSYEKREFSRMRDDEHAEIRLAIDMIAFAVISPGIRKLVRNSQGIAASSADRFQLLAQNFRPGDEYFSISSGNCISGGWKIGQIKFPQPWCIGSSFQRPDSRILDALSEVFGDNFPEAERRSIRKGLEWFRLAHTESEDVSHESKVVMMATALEALLAIPKEVENKQIAIAEWLDEHCTYSDSIKKKWNGAPAKEHTLMGYWARSFYDLRNRIVHGSDVQKLDYFLENGTRTSHKQIASVVFWECLVRKLIDTGCFAKEIVAFDSCLDKDAPDYAASRATLIATLFNSRAIHRAYGWLPPIKNELVSY